MNRLLFSALCLLPLAQPARAVTIGDCDDYRASVGAMVEPWEEATRTWANGKIRLVVTDTVEPAMYPFHLVVIYPGSDETGWNQCSLVSFRGMLGFAGMELMAATAQYDPAAGLTVAVPVRIPDPEAGDVADAILAVTINQMTGQVRAQLE